MKLNKYAMWVANVNLDHLMFKTTIGIITATMFSAYVFDKQLTAAATSHSGYWTFGSLMVHLFAGALFVFFWVLQKAQDHYNHKHHTWNEPWIIDGHEIRVCSCEPLKTVLYTSEWKCTANPFKNKQGMCEYDLTSSHGEYKDPVHCVCKHCGVGLGKHLYNSRSKSDRKAA